MSEIAAISSDTHLAATGAVAGTGDFRQSPAPDVSNTGSATISFDDLLDALNPLQHIPLVSSLYRAATGQNINPVARIAGDALYGGVFGLASAGISALGAAGDEMFASINDGKSLSETVVAGLFGDDKGDAAQNVQLASNATPAAPASQIDITPKAQPGTIQLASLQTPAPQQSPILQTPDAAAVNVTPAPVAASDANAGNGINVAKAYPINRNAAAYGGVMDTTLMQNAQQNQALALAMGGQQGIMQAQRALRSNRFQVATPATNAAAAVAPSSMPVAVQLDPDTQAAMQKMVKELQTMKGINGYKNAAQSTPVPGATLDTAN